MRDGAILGRILDRRAGEVLRQRERVRSRGGARSIHDLRVAARRLEEAIELLTLTLSEDLAGRLRRRCRAIRKSLGRAREADVREEWLARLQRTLRGEAASQARAARRRAREEACSFRKARGGIDVRTIARRVSAARAGLAECSPSLLRRRERALLASRSKDLRAALGPARSGEMGALHRLRIALKRYRYTLELLADCGTTSLPKEAIEEARRLQRKLGTLRDQEQLLVWLAKGGAARDPLMARLQDKVETGRRAAVRTLTTFKLRKR